MFHYPFTSLLGSVPPLIWLPLFPTRTTLSVYYQLHINIFIWNDVIALEVRQKGSPAFRRFASNLNLSRALWRNLKLLCLSTCLDISYHIQNIHLRDGQRKYGLVRRRWWRLRACFFVYLTCNLTINIWSFHPALLQNRNPPPKRCWSRPPHNPKGRLLKTPSKTTPNLKSTTIYPLNRIIKHWARRISSRSPRSM